MEKHKISILSNIMVGLIEQKLKKKYDVYVPSGFNAWISEVINVNSNLYNVTLDAIFVILDGTEFRNWTFEESLETINMWYETLLILLENKKEIPIFISTVDIRRDYIITYSEINSGYAIENKWQSLIMEICEKNDNAYIIDVKNLILNIGRNNFYSDKMWYMSSMPYSKEGLQSLLQEINYALDSVFVQRKKVIALDLDNTLWGGVIGEDGVDGIELSDHKQGQRYYDFQHCLLEMKKRGALLVINSKNNYDDVMNVFENHSYMLLKKEDFIDMKINWINKADNLSEISQETNITQAGFVFIDDNPIEQEIVKKNCIGIDVLQFPQDTSMLNSFAETFYKQYFKQLRSSDEDTKKTEMYQLEKKRKKEKKTSLNMEDYIKNLELCVDIHTITTDEIDRAIQLINKTNQFNLTTIRYTYAEFSQMLLDDNTDIFVIYCKDKYGDSGMIGLVIVRSKDKEKYIDTFLMSCRAMGRMIENVIIDEICKYYSKYAHKILAKYIATSKNKPVECLYENLGFDLTGENLGEKNYVINLDYYNSPNLSYFKKISFKKV